LEGEQLKMLATPAVRSEMVVCGTSNTSRVYTCCAETLTTNTNTKTNDNHVAVAVMIPEDYEPPEFVCARKQRRARSEKTNQKSREERKERKRDHHTTITTRTHTHSHTLVRLLSLSPLRTSRSLSRSLSLASIHLSIASERPHKLYPLVSDSHDSLDLDLGLHPSEQASTRAHLRTYPRTTITAFTPRVVVVVVVRSRALSRRGTARVNHARHDCESASEAQLST